MLHNNANVANLMYCGKFIRLGNKVRKIFIIMKQVATQMHWSRSSSLHIKYNYTLLLPGSFLITSQKITAIEIQLDWDGNDIVIALQWMMVQSLINVRTTR